MFFRPVTRLLLLCAAVVPALCLIGAPAWAGKYFDIVTNTQVLFDACMRRCDRTDALGNLTRNGCVKGCEEMRRTFPLRAKKYRDLGDCLEAYAKLEVDRDEIIEDNQEWCIDEYRHLHKRQGCKDAVTTFYKAATAENMCGARSGAANAPATGVTPLPPPAPLATPASPPPTMLMDTPKVQQSAPKAVRKTGTSKPKAAPAAPAKPKPAIKPVAPSLEKDAPMPEECRDLPLPPAGAPNDPPLGPVNGPVSPRTQEPAGAPVAPPPSAAPMSQPSSSATPASQPSYSVAPRVELPAMPQEKAPTAPQVPASRQSAEPASRVVAPQPAAVPQAPVEASQSPAMFSAPAVSPAPQAGETPAAAPFETPQPAPSAPASTAPAAPSPAVPAMETPQVPAQPPAAAPEELIPPSAIMPDTPSMMRKDVSLPTTLPVR